MASQKARRIANGTSKREKNGTRTGEGGEPHQVAGGDHPSLTTNQGIPVSDNQNSLRVGPRGPTLLEDFVLREKITHFDHERIPERVVHARGTGAHGFFETTESLAKYTRADFLQHPGERTPVFVRFSTVAGGVGSKDTARDVRGFAVKFYTKEGNFDLVGNNIPVFFIQDAIKFPDLIHAAKQEPDRGFPQAATAHDTFWDFVSLLPESTHMLMWAMSDRAIPRSLRMMEGFGVHTFKLVDARGDATLVKFHWRPRLGMQSLVWDEAVKIGGADPDYHRRDLWNAIAEGNPAEWDLCLQLFDEKKAASFDFDVLDATKMIPEELVPLRRVGRLVLDRNPDNFFAETEQVAFCPANVVPGIDFTDDPLLQGRLFSYLDTQLTRLGGPNFHEIPVNRPQCPMRNLQRDGHMRQLVPTGRVAYEPNSLAGDAPLEDSEAGYQTQPETHGEAEKRRVRAESFADHFSQARLFYVSQTPPERDHIVSAFTFELSKVEAPAIRERMVTNLRQVDDELAERVARGLRLSSNGRTAAPASKRAKIEGSPALSILAKAKPTLEGRVIGCLVTDGTDGELVAALAAAAKEEGADLKLVAPHIGGVTSSQRKTIPVHFQLDGGPSVLFDAIVLAPSAAGAAELATRAAAVDFVRDAFGHLKVIGHVADANPLLDAAHVEPDEGIVKVDAKRLTAFIAAARAGRRWPREPKVRPAP